MLTRYHPEMKKYMLGRALSTRRDIELQMLPGGSLQEILANRKRLAQTYAEDGVIETARCIENIDIPMIEAAIRKAA